MANKESNGPDPEQSDQAKSSSSASITEQSDGKASILRPRDLLVPDANETDGLSLGSPSPTVSSVVDVSPKLCATAVPGILSNHNDGAFDWGWQGCIAYGCQSLVVVIDARSMQKIQVLDHHRHPVSQVRWARENYCHGPRQTYNLRLASADVHGLIVVWDVVKGVAQSKFGESEGPVCDMAWHWHQDATQDMLLCLHAHSSFVLWNASTGTIIWKKVFSRSEHLESFDLDPHLPNRTVFIAADGVYLMRDLTLFKPPVSDLEKVSWIHNGKSEHSPRASSAPSKDTSISPSSLRSDIRQRAVRLLARNSITALPSTSDPDSNFLMEIFFHRSIHDVLIAVYPRQIVFVSLRYASVFRTISIEKVTASLSSVIPLRQIDAFYCLHSNGSISFRYLQKLRENFQTMFASYDVAVQPEGARLLKPGKVFGVIVDPVSEAKTSILLSDGRILTWELDSDEKQGSEIMPRNFARHPKIILSHISLALQAPQLVVQSNLHVRQGLHLLAIGSGKGTVQIYMPQTNKIVGEYFIHNNPIHGVEWITEDELLVYSHPVSSGPAALIRNEVALLDLLNGQVRLIRKSTEEESPIRIVKISPSREHFVLVFKNGAPEVWSIRDGRKLVWHRSRAVPHATAAEWVVVVHQNDDDEKTRKELILFVDLKGMFQAFKVKGNILHEDRMSIFTTQTTIGHVTAMCRRRNKIVMGDVDGSLIKWTPSESTAESKNLNRGWIKAIRFSPKDKNMWAAVLFSDGLDVWEIETMELINQMKPKNFRVNSVDWVSATHLALACTDGTVRIYDCRNFYTCSSPLSRDSLPKGTANPYLLTSESSLKTKSKILLGLEDGSNQSSAEIDPADLQGEETEPWDVQFHYQDRVNTTELCTVDRCLNAALMMGDESDYHFWKTCMRCLPCGRSLYKASLAEPESSFLLEKEPFRERFFGMAQTVLSSSSVTNSEASRKCVRDLISVGKSSQAVEFLLGLDPTEEHYYSDCLKAALLTALNGSSTEAVQSTIKLVATNLIASNPSTSAAGIELLCMIGKVLDACRYLQSCGNYGDAACLARICLDPNELKEIHLRWVDHLCAPEINQKSFALLICLHAGCLDRALELMAMSRQFERAALFLRACEEDGLLEQVAEKNTTVCEAVYLEYARYLHSIDLRKEALKFCDKSGKNGQLLRQEFEILNHDVHLDKNDVSS